MAQEIDPNKIAAVAADATKKYSNEIREAAAELNPKFANLIKSIASVNEPLAKSVAELRKTSKATFTGALTASKLAGLTSTVDKYINEGKDSLDPKELRSLQKNFVTASGEVFDFESLREISSKIQGTETALESALAAEMNAIKAKEDRIATAEKAGNVLGKIDQQINALKEKQLTVQGSVLNKTTSDLKNLEKQRSETQDRITAGYDQQIKDAEKQRELIQANLDTETEIRQTYNQDLSSILTESTNFEGLNNWSDGIKELTGVDLVGGLDTAVKKFNALKVVISGVVQGLGAGFSFISKKFTAGFTVVGGKIKSMWKGVTKSVTTMATGFMTGVKLVGTKLTRTVTKSVTFVTQMMMASIKGLGIKFIAGLKLVGTKLKGVAIKMAAALTPMLAAAGAFIAGLLVTAGGMLLAALPFIAIGVAIGLAAFAIFKAGMWLYEKSETFREFIDNAWVMIKQGGENIVNFFTDLWNNVSTFFTETFESVSSFFSELDLLGTITNIVDTVTGFFTTAFDRIYNWLGGEGSFADKLMDMISGLWEAIKAPIKAVQNFLGMGDDPDIPETKDPIQVAEEIGVFKKNILGESEVNMENAQKASPEVLQAIVDDNDIAAETKVALEKIISDKNIESVRKNANKEALAAANIDAESTLAEPKQPVSSNLRLVGGNMVEDFGGQGFAAVRSSDASLSNIDDTLTPIPTRDAGSAIKESRNEVDDSKEKKTASMAVQNIVGGQQVTNINNSRTTMSRPNVDNSDMGMGQLNRSMF